MPRESLASKKKRAVEVCRRMEEKYGGAESALDYYNPYTLLIAVMLSAQTTDAAVNRVTPEFFRRWPDAFALAQADPAEVGEVIRSIGFWRAKAEHAVEAAQIIVAEHGGEVPKTMAELTKLPGVGRKTANIVLNKAFHDCEGIAVDTHVFRIATRLGLTKASVPLAAEQDLLKLIPKELWPDVNEQWILFGRETCKAQRPLCEGCMLKDLCPSFGRPDRYRKKQQKKADKKEDRKMQED